MMAESALSSAMNGDASDETDASPFGPFIRRLEALGFRRILNDPYYVVGSWCAGGRKIIVAMWPDGQSYAIGHGQRVFFHTVNELDEALIFVTLKEVQDDG